MSERIVKVGHSPDPDDAFMFYGLASEKVKLDGIKIEHMLEDIQSLNMRAMNANWKSPPSPLTHFPTSPINTGSWSPAQAWERGTVPFCARKNIPRSKSSREKELPHRGR